MRYFNKNTNKNNIEFKKKKPSATLPFCCWFEPLNRKANVKRVACLCKRPPSSLAALANFFFFFFLL